MKSIDELMQENAYAEAFVLGTRNAGRVDTLIRASKDAEIRAMFKPQKAELALLKIRRSIKEAECELKEDPSQKSFLRGKITAFKEAREFLLDMFREED